jgi:hypothetical protein
MRKALCGAVFAVLAVSLHSVPTFAQTTLTPSTLSFGNQVVNVASPAKITTFKNTQSVPLTISSITISGGTAPSDYASGGNCPISPRNSGLERAAALASR